MANAPARPRRSVLYMPGSNARALEKAKTIGADALIFDLEDATAPETKKDAREQVAAAVRDSGYGKREVIVRVNGLDTEWGVEDIAAAVAAGPDAILVPKIDNADMVRAAQKEIDAADAPESLQLWAMMETPKAMLHAEEIAKVAGEDGCRLSAWVMGTNDLAKELTALHTPQRLPMITGLGLSLLAARAYGLVILDGVYNDIRNEKGFREVTRQGRELGFDGKTLIHPSQVGPCNEIFAPPPEDVEQARKVIEAFDRPENRSKGALKVDGQMVERLHAEIARRTVAVADAISEMEA